MLAAYTLLSLHEYKKEAPEKLKSKILEVLGDTGNFTIVTGHGELVKKAPILTVKPQGKVPAIVVYMTKEEELLDAETLKLGLLIQYKTEI